MLKLIKINKSIMKDFILERLNNKIINFNNLPIYKKLELIIIFTHAKLIDLLMIERKLEMFLQTTHLS